MLPIHGNKVIKELVRRPQLPLGLAELHMDTDRSIYRTLPHSDDGLPAYTEQMEPGDRMHLYTDGVTEGRAADCSRFGIDLLSDFVIRHSHSGTPAPEMLRRPPGPSPNISTAGHRCHQGCYCRSGGRRGCLPYSTRLMRASWAGNCALPPFPASLLCDSYLPLVFLGLGVTD
jgi:hypothetical protein